MDQLKTTLGIELGSTKIKGVLLDENHNAELVRSEKVTSSDFTSYLNMELYSTYLIIVH